MEAYRRTVVIVLAVLGIIGGCYDTTISTPVPLPPPCSCAHLSWTPPAEDPDAVPLYGYWLNYGRAPNELYTSIYISPELTNTQVDNLAHGTWYFALMSVDEAFDYSWSNTVEKDIQ